MAIFLGVLKMYLYRSEPIRNIRNKSINLTYKYADWIKIFDF
jgi:hypothetical protein